jgi:hypothetical protein
MTGLQLLAINILVFTGFYVDTFRIGTKVGAWWWRVLPAAAMTAILNVVGFLIALAFGWTP